ncbi:21225_t:CDS:2 [Dentiscutata erythropus]|uniref:21225_t:CDS:1 n=1 Tax=Dentiscutata erythropus TaxID=1348616 RepID=A0A9N8ZWS6_9GLOM|nr:21225_t:CDS:2 [Dentiscutata erythropus]
MSQTDESPTTLSKTPTYEYYGFVLYLLSFIAFDDSANVGQNLSQLSKITDDFVPELHDIPIDNS